MAMAIPPAHTLTLSGVLSESKRIINTHSRHFLSLSLLFLLPLSSSILFFPNFFPETIQNSLNDTVSFHTNPNPNFNSQKALTFPIIYTIITYFLSIFALSTITSSTHHGFFGRPVHFLPSIKSIPYSFLPILTTQLAAKLLTCFLSFGLLIIIFSFINLLQYLNVTVNETDYDKSRFVWFCGVVSVLVLSSIVLWLQVIWGLSSVIAVTERKYGFEPLWRSAYLTKGMRSVTLAFFLIFGFLIGVWVWMGVKSVLGFGFVEDWKSWDFVMQTVITTGFLGVLMIMLLHYTAANTVLYMYCKALHGELAVEIAEEFAREYVSLPFDDAKVPHIVTVVSA